MLSRRDGEQALFLGKQRKPQFNAGNKQGESREFVNLNHNLLSADEQKNFAFSRIILYIMDDKKIS